MFTGIESSSTILGSILIDPDCLDAVRSEVTPEMFSLPNQQTIYQAACDLADEEQPVDPVTIGARVREMGGDWSNEYALQLMEMTPTSANVVEYCKVLRREAMARTLEQQTRRASEELQAGQDPFAVAQELTTAIEAVSSAENSSGVVSSSDTMLELSEAVMEAEERTVCLQTSYKALDGLLGGGLMSGCLYILAARPGQGKTTLGAAIAERVAKQGKTVLFVSLEMTRQQLAARRIAAHVGTVTATQVLIGDLDSRQMDEVTDAMQVLSKRKILFNRRGKVNVKEIQWLAQKNKVDLVVIDYLGLIQHGQGKSLYEKVTQTSNQLKQMTITLNVPVLCLAQLNREIEGQGHRPPRLSDLRDSGAIEQDADAVLLLHRPQREGEQEDYSLTPLDVIVEKNRYGPRGTVALNWSLRNGRIVEGAWK